MATVIKASGPIRPEDGMSFNFDDMSVRAGAYLDTIRIEAGDILAKARKEAEAIRRKAEEEGRQAAIKAVEKVMEEKVGKQLASLLPAIKQATDQLVQARQAWLAHWEKSAVQVATRIASRVIRREIKQDPQITVKLVRETLELAAGSTDVQLRLHPDDLATLGKHVETVIREVGRDGSCRVVADATVNAGGCRVDTRFGLIDQQIESQLQRIEEELT